MKKFFSAFLLLYMNVCIQAQTNPTPQTLPYAQNFSAVIWTSTVYPSGWQGWKISNAPGSGFDLSSPLSNKALTASGDAAKSSEGIYNYNGRLGFLNTGTNDLALCLSVNTSGSSNIVVQYDVGLIRNPYDGQQNTRINVLELQYRIGTNGNFISFGSPVYASTTTAQSGSTTTPLNPQTIVVTLPAACDNQSVVQLRFITRQNSGTGNRPSFAIDNVDVRTNGNATNYYWNGSDPLTTLNSWGINTDGSGNNPASFIADQQVFNLRNASSATINSDWTVSGTGSKIIVGNGTSAFNLTIPASNSIAGIIDLSASGILTLQNSVLPTFGTFYSGSSVVFDQSTSLTLPSVNTYNSLTLQGGAKTFSAGQTNINGNLVLKTGTTIDAPASAFQLQLGGDLTIESGVTLNNNFNSLTNFTLKTVNNNDQVFSFNSTSLNCWEFISTKTAGSLTFASGTNITVGGSNSTNDLILNYTSPASFYDGGNTITIQDDISIKGTGTFSLTGTLSLTASSGNTNFIDDGSHGVIKAALNNVSINTTGTGAVSFGPTTASPSTLTIKGNLLVNSTGTGAVGFMPTAVVNTVKLGGDFTNLRSTSTTQGSSTTFEFNGSTQQTLNTAASESFNNLKINNSNGLTMNGNVSVASTGTLTLASGTISTGSGELSVQNKNVNAILNYSSSAYINGNLRRSVNTTGNYNFPVGTNTNYELASVNLNSSLGISNILVSFTSGLPATMPDASTCNINGSGISTMLDGGYWIITPNAYTSVNYDISLNETGFTNFSGAAYELGIIKRADANSPWLGTDVSNTYGHHDNNTQTFSGNTATAKRTAVAAFSHFGIGFGTGALPVEIIRFDVAKKENTVVLIWETASEINNARFEIEKSFDGIVFEKAGTIFGNGTTSERHSYFFIDEDPLGFVTLSSVEVYYRLKQIDLDGKFSYSAIRSIDFISETDLKIFPMPVSDELHILIPSENEVVSVRISDAMGQKILEDNYYSINGEVKIPMTELPPGIYFLELIQNGRVTVARVVRN